MKEITAEELKKMQENNEPYQLIDVREPHEYEADNMEGELIPLGDILDHKDEIARDKKVIVHCRSGKRSATAIKQLEAETGADNLYNLVGGILAWNELSDD